MVEPLADSSTQRVSVIMLTYNRPQFISRAIASVVGQSYTEWELVVVQDGNHPETARILQDWQAREPRIRHLRRETPGNIGSALNHGIQHSRGDLVAILDDDDAWASPTKLARQVAFLEEHQDYVACGGGVRVVDENGAPQMVYRKPCKDSQIKAKALYANPVAHSTAVYRKSAALAVGLYEESIPDFQDWDFWLKMGKIGKLYNFSDTLLDYRLWNGGSSFRKLRSNARSAVMIVRRHRGEYSGGVAAQLLAYLYFCYAHLPDWLLSTSYSVLSRLKKRTFSGEFQALPDNAGQ